MLFHCGNQIAELRDTLLSGAGPIVQLFFVSFRQANFSHPSGLGDQRIARSFGRRHCLSRGPSHYGPFFPSRRNVDRSLRGSPVAGAGLCFLLLRRDRPRAFVVSYATMAILIFVTAFGLVVPSVDRHRSSFLLTDIIHRSGAQTEVGAFGPVEPSLIFYAERPVQGLLRESPLVPVAGAVSGSPQTVASFLRQPKPTVVITTDRGYQEIAEFLPPKTKILAEVPRFFRKDKLLLLGSPSFSAQLLQRKRRSCGSAAVRRYLAQSSVAPLAQRT